MRWKGKKVSKAHYFHLRRSVEYRLAVDRSSWGFNYREKPFKIGGKKNGKHIRTAFYSANSRKKKMKGCKKWLIHY